MWVKRRIKPIVGIAATLIVVIGIALINTNSIKELTLRERKAIGKVLCSLAAAEEKKMLFTNEFGETAGGITSEILTAGVRCLLADNLVRCDGWYDCPIEFQRAMKRVYTALGKAAILEVVEKYGQITVMDTLRQHNIDGDYKQFYVKAMSDGAVSITRELKKAQSKMFDCFSKYGIDGNCLAQMAVEEFSERAAAKSNQEVANAGKAAQALAAIAILGQMAQMAENQRQQQAQQWNDWGGFSTQNNDSRLFDMQDQLNEQRQRIQQLQQEQARQQQKQARQQQEQAWRQKLRDNAQMVKCPICEGSGFIPYKNNMPCNRCGTTGYIRDYQLYQ